MANMSKIPAGRNPTEGVSRITNIILLDPNIESSKIVLNPLSPNIDANEISLYMITAYSKI